MCIIREVENDKKDLIDENIKLKQEIRNLRTKIEVLRENNDDSTSTADVLRRISRLEKIIYGKE